MISHPEPGPAQPGQGPLPFDEGRYNEMVQDIGRILLQLAPPGWRRVDLRVLMMAPGDDIEVTLIMGDGTVSTVDPPPVIGETTAELRSRMYRQGEGTWFGMRYTLDPPSEYHVSYNFDFEPVWHSPVRADVYARDVAAFPRADEHIPGWLRAKLTEAADEAGSGGVISTAREAQ